MVGWLSNRMIPIKLSGREGSVSYTFQKADAPPPTA
jgi:hypothetical protein